MPVELTVKELAYKNAKEALEELLIVIDASEKNYELLYDAYLRVGIISSKHERAKVK